MMRILLFIMFNVYASTLNACDFLLSGFGSSYSAFRQGLPNEEIISPTAPPNTLVELDGDEVCDKDKAFKKTFFNYQFINGRLVSLDIQYASSTQVHLLEQISKLYGEPDRSQFMNFSIDFDSAWWRLNTFTVAYTAVNKGAILLEKVHITSNFAVDDLAKKFLSEEQRAKR